MQHVLAGREEPLEVLGVVTNADLRGLGVRAGEHLGVELGGGVGDAKVVLAGLAVEVVVEVEVLDVAALKPVAREIGGRAAAENVAGHETSSNGVQSLAS